MGLAIYCAIHFLMIDIDYEIRYFMMLTRLIRINFRRMIGKLEKYEHENYLLSNFNLCDYNLSYFKIIGSLHLKTWAIVVFPRTRCNPHG